MNHYLYRLNTTNPDIKCVSKCVDTVRYSASGTLLTLKQASKQRLVDYTKAFKGRKPGLNTSHIDDT